MMGRAKYKEWITPEGLAQIQLWRKAGLELREISKNIGISPQTMSEWQNKYPEIHEALKRGQAIAAQIVENALFKSAIGYPYEEITHELSVREVPRLDKDGVPMDGITDEVREMVETKRVKKFAHPNSTSIIFLLKNLDPDNFKDRRENVITGNLNSGPDLSHISTEDLMKAISQLRKSEGDSDASKPSE